MPTNELAAKVRRTRTLNGAWQAIYRNARQSKSIDTQQEIKAFEQDAAANLKRIAGQLQKGKFKFPPARGIPIPKGKGKRGDIRPLVVAKVEGRIVQRAVHDVLVTVPALAPYIYTPYSFGGVKKASKSDIAAVPAAVQAVLVAIHEGAQFYVRSDITAFFTRISKSEVTDIIDGAVGSAEPEFMSLFKRAITVELENMTRLKKHEHAFPLHDVGVAQGNSLSPLLGNVLLADFDKAMSNTDGVRCLRYIDDFIVLAPTQAEANTKFSEALKLLAAHGMNVSASKTARGSTNKPFEFLGVQFASGFIRPAAKSRDRHLAAVRDLFADSKNAIIDFKKSNVLDERKAYMPTLSKLVGIMQGWSKHYWFCRDNEFFKNLDNEIEKEYAAYRGFVRSELHAATSSEKKWKINGLTQHQHMKRNPFTWPKKGQPYYPYGVTPPPPEPVVVPPVDPDTPPWK